MATLSLDQVVELCKKCNDECARRVARFVEDVNPAPPIAKTQTDNNDRMRRDQAMEKCMTACSSVSAQCPSPDFIRNVVREQEEAVRTNKATGGDGKITFHEPQFQLRRCEGVVQNFVSTLFWIANAPTKYELDKKDYYEQRKTDLAGPKRNSSGGLGAAAGADFASEVLANAGGATAAQVQKGPNGEEILPGTSHLSSEQRAQLEKFRNLANPSGLQAGGNIGANKKGSWFS